jgi:hypothetical protein
LQGAIRIAALPKDDHMKHTKLMAIGTLLLLVSGASAQSLGDYARSARKNKVGQASANHHFDNDNLPTSDPLSVVGPAPSSDAKDANTAKDADARAAAAATERQKTTDEWKDKIEKQKAKIDALNHELDLDQREVRLREASLYNDPGYRLRNPGAWDAEDRKYKSDMEGKQKAIEDARQQLDEMQDQARKAGVAPKDREAADDKK